MHEGFTISMDAIIPTVLTGVLGVVSWVLKKNEALADKRLEKLETQQDKNTERLTKLETQVAIIDDTYVKQEDVREVVDALRNELYCDLDKSFNRVHERFDSLFEKKEAPQRPYQSESPSIDYGNFNKTN